MAPTTKPQFLKLSEKTTLSDLIGTPCKPGERYYENPDKATNTAKADVESGFADGFPTYCELAAEVAQMRFELNILRAANPSIFPKKINFGPGR